MTQHMQREMERLKGAILALSGEVEESFLNAVKSLESVDTPLAEAVIRKDEQIDRLEVDLEEDCLKILALHQPVAVDLRFIVSVLKINNDLERIADLAVNIAERTLTLSTEKRIPPPYDLHQMAGKVGEMFEKALDSLVNLDVRLAREVCHLDDDVDALHKNNYSLVKDEIRRNADRIDPLLSYITVSRHLERIADLATNIAEDVLYMIEGEIVRHTF